MYHYEQDKDFLSKLRTLCGEIIQECCHYLKEDEDIGANFYLVLSGAGILIAQNENEPIELGYNLEITRCEYPDNCYRIRNAMIRVFNKVLKKYGWAECQDTTYTLKTEKGAYLDGYDTEFYINLCVTTSDRYNTLYLLTRKTGKNGKSGRYFGRESRIRQKYKER